MARRCSRWRRRRSCAAPARTASTVVDNPAPDLKEVLGGYYLIEAADDEHARRIAERCPAPYGYIEVRPIWEIPEHVCRLTPVRPRAAEAQRRYWGRVLAATLRMARDVDVAEEATADAFLLALQTWPERGVPDSVEAWLLTAARRRAIDRIRRLVRLRERLATLAVGRRRRTSPADAVVDGAAGARRRAAPRRAVLPPGARRRGPGRADAAPRLRRADGGDRRGVPRLRADDGRPPRPGPRQRIAGSGEGIDLPDDVAVEERMPAVRRTVHLAYTMGHTAGAGAALRDDDLAAHAVRLARALHRLRPDDSECTGLLALVAAHRGPRGRPVGHRRVAGRARRRRPRDAGTAALVAEGLALVDGRRLDRAGPLGAAGRDRRRARPRRVVRRPPTGTASSSTTTPCCAASRARRSPSAAASPCPTGTVRRSGWPTSTSVLDLGGLDGYPYAHAARAAAARPARPDRRGGTVVAAAAACARTDAERDWFAGTRCRVERA